MAILHVVRRLDIVGGAEKLICELVNARPDHYVLVFDGGDPFFYVSDRKIIRVRGIVAACIKIWRERNNYQCIHLHLFPSIYFSLFLGRRSVIHEHNSHNRRRNYKWLRLLEREVYKRAKAVIAISESVADALRQWVRTDGLRIEVIPNFAPATPRGELQWAHEKKRGGNRVIAMVASFTEQKRQDLLIEAVQYLPKDVRVVLAGEGPKLRECVALAERVGVLDRVEFVGAIRDTDRVYQEVDLCVLLSRWEGFGLVVLEAATWGVPTVVSGIDGLRETCPDSRLLVNTDDAQQVAKIIVQVLEEVRKGTFTEELQKLVNKYSINQYVERLDKIYEK